MKTKKIRLENLRNENHHQFHDEIKQLLSKTDIKKLNLELLTAEYNDIFSHETEALNLIRKSSATEDIVNADEVRDLRFKALCDMVKSMQIHFDTDKAEAARRLKLVIDKNKDLPSKAYNDETAAIKRFVIELRSNYKDETALLGLNEWISALEQSNIAFETLNSDRYTEIASRTDAGMKNYRKLTDQTFRNLMERIDALMLINGTDDYDNLVREINVRVDKYMAIQAGREGRSKKKSEENIPSNNI